MLYSTKNLGMFERQCTDETLKHSIDICLKTLPHNIKYLHVLLRVLDMTSTYYAGIYIITIYT